MAHSSQSGLKMLVAKVKSPRLRLYGGATRLGVFCAEYRLFLMSIFLA